MEPREVRGYGEDTVLIAKRIQSGKEISAKLFSRHLSGRTSGGEIETHVTPFYAANQNT
jgi:hypothetical protein